MKERGCRSGANEPVLSFSGSLGELFDDPSHYGWNWDIQVGDPFAPALGEEADRLVNHPAVRAAAVGTISRLQIGSVRMDALATEVVRGALAPTVVEGRPNEPSEIMLGTRTLRELGAGIGATVSVAFGDRTADMRVVGRGVFTEFSGAGRLGEGAALTLEGLRRIVPDTEADLVLLRLDPTQESQALIPEIQQTTSANIYLPFKPSDLADLERVGGLPSIVAGILSVMAVATLAHTLTTSARRRRRDLAILKVLGFVRSQVSATVAWQSTVIAAIAVVCGVPSGSPLAAGAGRSSPMSSVSHRSRPHRCSRWSCLCRRHFCWPMSLPPFPRGWRRARRRRRYSGLNDARIPPNPV